METILYGNAEWKGTGRRRGERSGTGGKEKRKKGRGRTMREGKSR